jgi:hypothetical protein
MRVTYGRPPYKLYDLLRNALDDEARRVQQKLRSHLAAWEEQVAELRKRCALGDTHTRVWELHHKTVKVEQKELAEFRQALDPVVAALLDEPITVGQSTTTTREVSLALQDQPLRQAYVRIGTQTHVIKTDDLQAQVSPTVAAERFAQLQQQTRRDLCRRAGPEDSPVAVQPAGPKPKPPSLQPKAQVSEELPVVVQLQPRTRRSRPLIEGE